MTRLQSLTFVLVCSLALGAMALVVGRLPSSTASLQAAAPPANDKVGMFGGTVNRNMVNTLDKNIPDDWDVKSGKNIKWMAKLGSRSYGGPVVADGRVLVGTNNELPRNPAVKGDKGVIMCFDAATGAFLWQAIHNKLESGQVNDWPKEGICSSPAIEGDRVYYVSNRCELVCADLAGIPDKKEAKILWRLDMMKELGVYPHNMAAGCPLIVGDLVYTVTGNGVDEDHINLPSPDAPSFIAVNKHTGKLVWRDNSPGKNIMHGQWSNPTSIEVNGKPQIVFPGGDGWLRGFDPQTGEILWRFDANPKDSKYELGGRGTKSDFIATPVAFDNKIFIGTGQDARG